MRAVHMVLASTIVVSGCTDAVDEPTLYEVDQGVVVNNRIAANRIAANRIAANRIAANRIAANRIAANRITVNPEAIGDLLETPEGIELFSFVVNCALPEGETLVADDPLSPGDTIEFHGEVGLAPRWVDRPMNTRDKRWVSACMFARVNDLAQVVTISMRGPSWSLLSSRSERELYSLQEGAFYGDMFRPLDEPIQWFACRGRAKAGADPHQGGLVNRVCTEPDPANPGKTLCGFTDAGVCGDWERPRNRHACAWEAFGRTGFYLACRDEEDFGWGKNHHGHHHKGRGGNPDKDGHGYHRFGERHGHGNARWGGYHHDHDDHWGDGDQDHDDDWSWSGWTFHQVITTYVQP